MNYRFYRILSSLVVIGMIFCSPLQGNTIKWFKSSPGASMGDPLPDGGKEGMGWTLSVEHILNTEVITDYTDTEAANTPSDSSLESISDQPGETPSPEQTEDQQTEDQQTGTPPAENADVSNSLSENIVEHRTLYLGSTIQSIEILTRKDDRLVSWETQDPDGNTSSKIQYTYGADGQPQTSYIDIGDPESVETYVESWTSTQPDGQSIRQTYGLGGKWNIVDMDSTWRPTRNTAYDDGKQTREETWTRGQDGRLIGTSRQEDTVTVEKDYDENGRVIEERTIEGGIIVSTKTLTWEDDKLVKETFKKGWETRQREIQWEDGKIKHETYYLGGLKDKEIEWTAPKDRVETLYEGGNAMVRIYWNDDRRWKEEFLHKGFVVRTREYTL